MAQYSASLTMPRVHFEGNLSQLGRFAIALVSLSAAAIHFVVVRPYFAEWWVDGVAMGFAAWFQLLWACTVISRPSRAIYYLAVLANSAIVTGWAVTRTIGMPFGPYAGLRKPPGFMDLVATGFEVAIILGAAFALLNPAMGRRPLARGAKWAGRVVVAALVVPLATASLLVTGAQPAGQSGPVRGHADYKIEAHGLKWGSLKVEAGSRVVWTTADMEHNIVSTSGPWHFSKNLMPGHWTDHVFDSPGIYRYRCTLHSYRDGARWKGMTGTIRVVRG